MSEYRCPSCGTGDPWAYTRCQWSGCPDGRDPRPDNCETRLAAALAALDEARAEVDALEDTLEAELRAKGIKPSGYLNLVTAARDRIDARIDALRGGDA